ncbi:hypothetical protein OAL25_00080 [bacterium]|nr:hypothetical protein [bacterium]
MAIDLTTSELGLNSKEGFFNEGEAAIDAAINATGWWKLTQNSEGQFTAASTITEAPDEATLEDGERYIHQYDEDTTHVYIQFEV